MPIDIELFRRYSDEDQKNWRRALENELAESEKELASVETKVRTDIATQKDYDINPLLKYRDEIKSAVIQMKSDINLMNKCNSRNENNSPTAASIAATTGNSGTVNIRADDRRNIKIEKALTYQQILAKRDEDFEAKELCKLKERIDKLDDYRKFEESKRKSETTKK